MWIFMNHPVRWSGWWLNFFDFPFHIWDVIPTPLTNSIIFQGGHIAPPTRRWCFFVNERRFGQIVSHAEFRWASRNFCELETQTGTGEKHVMDANSGGFKVLANIQKRRWKITMKFSVHQRTSYEPCSIAMLVYQRVCSIKWIIIPLNPIQPHDNPMKPH